MSDQRKAFGSFPWTGGLSALFHPMLVENNDMTAATDIVITLDRRKRLRSDYNDEYGILYTAATSTTAFGAP